jgi:hypothetical protein
MSASGTERERGASFDLFADAWGRLVLVDAKGLRHEGVEPVRAFPMTFPGQWVSIVDENGHELILVEDLAALPEAIRKILEQELARREFVPVIRAILSVSGDSSPSEWRVDTDRGPTTFSLDSDEGIRRLSPSRIVITDARGTRFQVPDIRALDAASRRRLERYL